VRYRVLLLLATSVALLAAVWALDDGGRAAAYDSYTDNESPTTFRWLDDPSSIGPVALWKRSATEINHDWWRFNVSAGQLVELKFRKYTQEPNNGLPGYTFYIKYEVFGPFSSSNSIYSYEYTYPRQGNPLTDRYRRDAFSFVAPDAAGSNGNYFVHVYLDPPQNDPWRDWGFYWLNITATDRPSLDFQGTYSGVMEMRGDYVVDYNFEDRFTINLTSARDTGDLARLHLHRSVSGAPVVMEAREVLKFGLSAVEFMVNRTYITTGTDQDVYFTADHDGMYEIRVFRGFDNPGACAYQLDVTTTPHALEDDDKPAYANPVTKATTFRHVPIELGYNNHEWYAASLLAGDTVFKVTVDLEDANMDGHAYQMYVYDVRGFPMWSVSNRFWNGDAYEYRSTLELPPPSVPTIFDEDTTYYIRLSTDPALCGGGVTGFRETYTMTVELSNRAPVLAVPFEDLYAWDEDTPFGIELDSHFTDPDGDTMEYLLYNRTTGFNVDGPSLDHEGWLNITPPVDWSGEVWWRLRAADKNAPDARHYIFIDLRLRVLDVPDLPRVNQSIVLSCDEEGSASGSLRTMFYDVDQGAGGVLAFDYYDDTQTAVAVELDRATGAFTLTPGPEVYGKFTLVFTAMDDQGVAVPGNVELTVNGVNDIPRIVSPIPVVTMTEGDAPLEVDVGGHFEDVDGDPLNFIVKFPKDLENKVNAFNKNNVVTESTLVIELLDDDFYGTFAINISAQDPSGAWAQQDMTVSVRNVPDRPELEWAPDGNPPDIDEGGRVELKVTGVYDADAFEAGLHTFIWYLDDEVVPDHNLSSFTYLPDYESSGKHTVKVIVRDPTGLEATSTPQWTVTVKDVNRPPTANIKPFDISGLNDKDPVVLSINSTDPDGDELIVTWWLLREDEDVTLGVGSTITTRLPAGSITIEVEVSDGRGPSVKDRIDLNVVKVKESGGSNTMLLGIIGVVVVAVIVVVALLATRGKGKGGPAKPKRSLFDRDEEEEGEVSEEDVTVPDYDEILRKSRK
jgi:hypothetical protein